MTPADQKFIFKNSWLAFMNQISMIIAHLRNFYVGVIVLDEQHKSFHIITQLCVHLNKNWSYDHK